MTNPRRYKSGDEFPSEHFVQASIEKYFSALGFVLDTSTHVDLLCSHPSTDEKWHIEAKGLTSQPGLDFRTCLGQLLQRMKDEKTNYGIAVPKLPKYIDQIDLIAPWVVNRMGLNWLLVEADGSIAIVAPSVHPESQSN